MSVYKRPHGRYDYDFRIKGVRFCGPTGATSERTAREVERVRKTQERQRLATIREQSTAPMTLNVALDRFWTEVGEHYTGTYRDTVWGALKWLLADLGAATLIRDIGPNTLAATIARRRADDVKNSTVNRTVTELMRRVFIRAARQWEQEVRPIAWRTLMLPEPKERIRELRDHEEEKVFASMRDDYRPALAFFLASGCRLKEVVSLKWSAIDWTNRTVSIMGKGDKPATIPLTTQMRAILSPLRGHHPEFVFTYVGQRTRKAPRSGKTLVKGTRYPITHSGMKTAWRRHGGPKAGLQDFRLHDTRHTTATRLLRITGNLKLVQKLLRHENITTTAKYAHADDADLRAAMEKVATRRLRKVPQDSRTRKKANAK